jgi:hypothetical protein
MIKEYIIEFIQILIFYIFILSIIAFVDYLFSYQEENPVEFFDGNKTVICQSYEIDRCGFHAKKCSNGVIYSCMQNVRRVK